jgi:hypothetical protein
MLIFVPTFDNLPLASFKKKGAVLYMDPLRDERIKREP